MRPLAIVILAVAIVVPAAARDQMNVKGLRLAMTPAEVDALHPAMRCSTLPVLTDVTCEVDPRRTTESTSIDDVAESKVGLWKLEFHDGRLVRATAQMIDPMSYRSLDEAITAKWGKPKEISVPASRAGSGVVIHQWADGAGTTISLGQAGYVAPAITLSGREVAALEAKKSKDDAARRSKQF